MLPMFNEHSQQSLAILLSALLIMTTLPDEVLVAQQSQGPPPPFARFCKDTRMYRSRYR